MATIISNNILSDLNKLIDEKSADSIFILTDEKTKELCLPVLFESEKLRNSHVISIAAGDENKNINSALGIWEYMVNNGATRASLMINLGGGMITDIGGFTASTFKRGMDYINISTTLLGAVDAATGGKTGINFLGLKNEIGVFAPAKAVLISVDFFKTLDDKNLRSGFAEMVKHALIDSRESWNEVLAFDLNHIDFNKLKTLLKKNIDIKESIVAADPKEKGIRKALNLGHTFGHAFESLSYRTEEPVLHGYAVAWGLLCELYLSHIKLNFPKEDILRLRTLIKEYYGMFYFSCKQYDALYELMTHDKKNESKDINFTLLSDVGEIKINQTASKDEIFECFDYLREG
ncbi:3-dehydroquinate synthase [Paludibacter sp. 221]|uniref:3-dehydroquinate synthase n=1 Tax=Paludibacter sp. 221 TaxID=2302939 RepID=UPI0013D84BC5|nr:3-dehydroquinate synthase [Paludibacter sp. 221]NDV45631.1 3-dehydroquinate synthase [Paludibacter sp. 221]